MYELKLVPFIPAKPSTKAPCNLIKPNVRAKARTLHAGKAIRVLVLRGKRQQSDVACLLDGAGQAALVRGADAGQTARHNLAALGHKPLQQADVAIRNR